MVKLLRDGNIVAGNDSLYASAVIDKKINELIIKLVNTASSSKLINLDLKGIILAKKDSKSYQLSAKDMNSYNTLEKPNQISPLEKSFVVKANKFSQTLDAHSVSVFRIPYQSK